MVIVGILATSVVLTLLVPVCTEGETPSKALARLEATLSLEKFNGWLENTKTASCQLRMPRFEIAGRSGIIPALSRMGVVAPFTSGAADFSKMTGSSDFYLSNLFQSARIKIDENGVEASAATIATLTAKSIDSSTPFLVNQPSLALLRDVQTGRLLFVARLAVPASSNGAGVVTSETPAESPGKPGVNETAEPKKTSK
jgi:serine protease inhibitor